MDTLHWSDLYNVGIERIDYQHRYFLELINWLSFKLQAGGNEGLRQRYIEEVMKYASFHFFSEETQMLECGYPELPHHRELHRELINQLNQIASRLEMSEIDAAEFIHFLAKWFLLHTVEEDGKFGRFLSAGL